MIDQMKHDLIHPRIFSNVTMFQVACLGASLGFIVLLVIKTLNSSP